MSALLVAVGGAVGSVLRYWMSGMVQRFIPAPGTWAFFPAGTLAVNVLGCLIIGALAEVGDRRGPLSEEARGLLMAGFLGGFTTFSAFANETVTVWRHGTTGLSMAYVAATVVLCLSATVAGRGLIAAILR